ncbi:MAG: tyrosine-type recombinase/integrase [Candidatus Cybelea sp.]
MARTATKKRQRKPKSVPNGAGSVFQRARDGRWVVMLSEREGDRIVRKSFVAATSGEALARRDRYKAAKGEPTPPEQKKAESAGITLHACIEEFLADTLKECEPNTWASYSNTLRNHVDPRLGKCLLAGLTPEIIKDTLKQVRENVSPAMESRCWSNLHTACGFAVEHGYIAENPVVRPFVRKSRKARAANGSVRAVVLPTPDTSTAKAIIAAASVERLGALYVVGLTCGLRFGELAGLHWTDVDFDNGAITVRHQVRETVRPTVENGKTVNRQEVEIVDFTKTETGDCRVIHLPELALDALRSRRTIAEREKRCKLVFPAVNGTPLRRSNFARSVTARISEKVGFPVTMHSLRRAMATMLNANGISLRVVADRLGQAGTDVASKHYVHSDDDANRRAAKLLDGLLSA